MVQRMNSPIVIPRWVLTAKYAIFVILGALTFVRGLVTLDLTTPASYQPFWAGAVALGAVVALVGSIDPRGEKVEQWAAAWIAGWLSFLAVQAFFISTGAGWLFIAMVTLLPVGRAFMLFSRRKPHDPRA
jgi:hypothetical protein